MGSTLVTGTGPDRAHALRKMGAAISGLGSHFDSMGCGPKISRSIFADAGSDVHPGSAGLQPGQGSQTLELYSHRSAGEQYIGCDPGLLPVGNRDR